VPADQTAARLVVLIDAENASAAVMPAILAEVATYGTAHVKRAYGDWTGTTLKGWKPLLLTLSIHPAQQFSYTAGKNASDAAMVIDAMDLLYTGRFDGFCIVSSDSDFTRLASRIRESGLTVYGFGERKTPGPFVAACDRFTYVENLHHTAEPTAAAGSAPSTRPTAKASLSSDTRLVGQLRAAVETASDDDGWAALAHVGHLLTQQSPDFDPRTWGHPKLAALVKATGLFDTDRRRSPGATAEAVYIRDRRRKSTVPQPVSPPVFDDCVPEERHTESDPVPRKTPTATALPTDGGGAEQLVAGEPSQAEQAEGGGPLAI
jgi:hypothetical protein